MGNIYLQLFFSYHRILAKYCGSTLKYGKLRVRPIEIMYGPHLKNDAIIYLLSHFRPEPETHIFFSVCILKWIHSISLPHFLIVVIPFSFFRSYFSTRGEHITNHVLSKQLIHSICSSKTALYYWLVWHALLVCNV